MIVSQTVASKSPIVIVGAGPTGLMAALVLTEAGVPVEIYGQSASLMAEKMDNVAWTCRAKPQTDN